MSDDEPLLCCPRFSWGDGTHDLNCPQSKGGHAIEWERVAESMRRAMEAEERRIQRAIRKAEEAQRIANACRLARRLRSELP